MKTLLIYSSLTGNTKKVADAVREVLPENTDFYKIDDSYNVNDYDFITVGFWIDKGNADKKTLEVLKTIKNKKVAYFFTLGAYPNSEHAQKCTETINSILISGGNTLLGHFLCQGKIDSRMTEMFKKFPEGHPHAMTEERKKRHAEAAKHPDESDLNNAKIFFAEIVMKILK